MNNDVLNDTPRGQELRYTPINTDLRDRDLAPDRHEKPAREGTQHAAKLASLSILFSLMVVFGTLAFVINNRPRTTGTRASSENLYGPASISNEEKQLTSSITEYPKTYKDRPIPENLTTEGTQKHITLLEADRKAYIINRIVLYYIYDDVLTTNNIPHARATAPLTFDSIEATVPQLSTTMKKEYPQPEIFVNQYLERFGY